MRLAAARNLAKVWLLALIIAAAFGGAGWVLGGPKGAATRLGMKRSTLHWKMKKLGITRPD